MSQYTKGNWQAEAVGNEGKYCIHTGDVSLPFAHTFPNRYRRPQLSSEEAEANAHLIAAAPRMAQLLERLVNDGWNANISEEAKEILNTIP